MYHTANLVAVAVALLERPADRHWAYDLAKRSDVRSGALYRILGNLHGEGWLTDGWEEQGEAAAEGRPPRRYYKLTPEGLDKLAALRRSALRRRAAQPRPAAIGSLA